MTELFLAEVQEGQRIFMEGKHKYAIFRYAEKREAQGGEQRSN